MKVATLGIVSTVSTFTPKGAEEPVRQVYIATGEHMIKCDLEEGQDFAEMDVVLVAGELGTFDRRVYVTGARVRLASPEDRAFFSFSVPPRVAPGAPVNVSPAVVKGAAPIGA